jgi:hypothetical protein
MGNSGGIRWRTPVAMVMAALVEFVYVFVPKLAPRFVLGLFFFSVENNA